MKIAVVAAVAALASLSLACGDDNPKRSTVNKSSSPRAATTRLNDAEGPVAVGPFAETPGAPASYTFLDTPDANLCVDAFIRRGITLPPTTVARTMDAFLKRTNGIAISDLDQSTTPILNVVHLESKMSNVMFQFYNRTGYYCIVKNHADFSDVKIQRACTAQIAYIEPMTTISRSAGLGLFWPFIVFNKPDDAGDEGTVNAHHSSISELPCVP